MRWKRVFAILLSMMLVMGMTPSTVWAEEVSLEHSHALNEDGVAIEFTECSEITDYIIDEDVSYYLTEDVELTEVIMIVNNATVNICLNGHTITQSATDTVFSISSGATLNLCDCSAEGEGVVTTSADISTDTKSGIQVYGIFNMYGGTITGFTQSAVNVGENGHFNMYDGKISGNSTSYMYGGGGVYLERSFFYMYGGEISGNTSTTDGGGVTVGGNSVFDMYGGTISNNTATDGGGVLVFGSTDSFYGIFTMFRGEIHGNKATSGGAVCCSDYSRFEMAAGTIYGNEAEEGSAVYIFGNGNGNVSFVGGSVVGNNVTEDGGGAISGQVAAASKITIAGADVQIIDNYRYGTYDEATGKYTGAQAANLDYRMQVTVSEELDPQITKIGTSCNHIEQIVAYPDGENITSLAGMEACFVSDLSGYLVCNENGELILLDSIFVHHPTLLEPYVEVYPGLDVDYQWYEITYNKQEEVTDQNASTTVGSGEGTSTYDAEKGWSGYGISPEQGYYEYFTVPMEAGQTLIVDVEGNVTWELGFVEYEIMNAIVLQPNETNTYAFTVERAGNYVFTIFGTTADTTVKAYLGSVTENVLSKETTNRLQKAEIGKLYYCKATLSTGTQATSGSMFYDYYITHQPTAGEPWIELNESEGITYQWHKAILIKEEITDKEVEPSFVDEETGATNYDEENGWSSYTNAYFYIDLEAGETLTIDIADDVQGYIGIQNISGPESDRVDVDSAGTYTLTAPISSEYILISNTGVNLKAYVLLDTVGEALEGENDNRLQNSVVGERYCCQITTTTGKVITSNAFENVYAITHQPTEEEPFVRVNDDTDATYQWYRWKQGLVEITDDDSSVVMEYMYDKGLPIYNSETGWLSEDEYGPFHYFYISLDPGETIIIDVDADSVESVFVAEPNYYYEYQGVLVEGTRYTITTYNEGCYALYVSGVDAGTTIRVYREGEIHTKIDGQTTDTLTVEDVGQYYCEVTFANDTTEKSNLLCVHTWQDGTCTMCNKKCAHPSMDDEGNCTDCKEAMGALIKNEENTTYYRKVEDAVAVLKDGDTLQLLQDFFVRSTVEVDKEITFDLNGHNVSTPSSPNLVFHAPVVLKDSVGTGYFEWVDIEFHALSKIENVKIYASVYFNAEGYTAKDYLAEGYVFHSYDRDNGIADDVLNATNAVQLQNVAVVACTHTWSEGHCQVCGMDCAHENYKDGFCELCGIECEHTWGDYTYDDNATCEENGTKTAVCEKGCGKKNVIEAEGTKKGHSAPDGDGKCSHCEEVLYVLVTNEEDTTYHRTLEQAFAVVEDGDIVKLLQSVTVRSTVEVDKEITFDLNGHVVTTPSSPNLVFHAPVVLKDSVGTGYFEWVDIEFHALSKIENVKIYASVYFNAEGYTAKDYLAEGYVFHSYDKDNGIADDVLNVTNAVQLQYVAVVACEHDWSEGHCPICGMDCTHETYKDGKCEVCGIVCTHEWGEYVSDDNATCQADGTKTAECQICDMTDTITDEGTKKAHTDANNDGKCDVGGEDLTVKVTGVTLNKTSATKYIGETLQLTATIKPTNATNKGVTYSTSDSSLATVNKNGLVTINKKGKTGKVVITVTTADGKKTAKCTITVKIKSKYNIVFNGNGNTSGSMKKLTNRIYGVNYTLTTNAFKKKGYTFNGWNTRKDGSGKSYANKASVKNLTSTNGKTVTLYAQWKKTKYTIKYVLNGGKNNKSNKTSYYITTGTFTFKNPTRKGYTFKGWYTDKKFKNKITQIKMGTTGSKTLYAKWAKKKYTITYILNGGKNNKSNKASYYVTTGTFTFKNPTRKGYVFKGWYSDKKCTKKVTKITKGSTGNIKLYAKWVKKK